MSWFKDLLRSRRGMLALAIGLFGISILMLAMASSTSTTPTSSIPVVVVPTPQANDGPPTDRPSETTVTENADGTTTTTTIYTNGDGSTVGTYLAIGALIALLATLVFGLVSFGLNLSGSDPDSPGIARQIAPSPVTEALVERWLRRSRFYRFLGGTLAVILGSGIFRGGLNWMFFYIVVGVALGGALAEIHFRRRRRPAAIVAELSVRRVSDYTHRSDDIAMAVVGAAAVLIVVAGLLDLFSASIPWSAAAGLVVVAIWLLQRNVATRSRPALDSDLREADNLLRYLAATQGFARPAISVAMMMLAVALSSKGDSFQLQDLFSVAAAIVGIAWFFRGRQKQIPAMAREALVA